MQNDIKSQKIKDFIKDKYGFDPTEFDPFGPLMCFDEDLTIGEIVEKQNELKNLKPNIGLKTLYIPQIIAFLTKTRKLYSFSLFLYYYTGLVLLIISIIFFFSKWYIGIIFLLLGIKEFISPSAVILLKNKIRKLVLNDYEVYYILICSRLVKIKLKIDD